MLIYLLKNIINKIDVIHNYAFIINFYLIKNIVVQAQQFKYDLVSVPVGTGRPRGSK